MKHCLYRFIYKTVSALLCFSLMLSLSGCWDSRELDKLAIVSGIGIDISTEELGKVQISAQIVKPQGSGSSGGGMNSSGGDSSSSGGAYLNLKYTGETVFSAMRNMTSRSSRKLFFPHNEILIFGYDTAEGGIQRYLDFFERDHETRNTTLIAVSETSAEDVLNVQPELENVTATDIANMIREYAKATSQTQATKITDYVSAYMSETTAAVAPMLKVVQNGDKAAVELSGTAVFKSDRIVGKLNEAEGRGLMWVLGTVKSGVIVVETPQGGLMSSEIIRSKTKINPVLEDGKFVIKIDITEDGNIGEQSSVEDLSELSNVTALEDSVTKEIESEINAALKKAKELNADIFGFGAAIKGKYPSQWEKMKNNWDESFSTLDVELSVDATLRITGRISKPLAPE